MNYETKHYLDALFDADDYICLGATPFATNLAAICDLSLDPKDMAGYEYVAVNPFKPGTKRLDANVSVFRNIVLEFDDAGLDDQAALIEELRIPYTTVTFSGGKSLHVVISLVQPCADRGQYDALVKDIYACVPMADPTSKNPSRFTRLGGATRPTQGGGIEQRIMDVGYRAAPADISSFLRRHSAAVMKSRAERAEQLRLELEARANAEAHPEVIGDLSLRTKDFLRLGAAAGGRNRELFYAACDFINQGYAPAEIHQKLLAPSLKSGLTEFEIARTIESAFQKASFRPRIRG